MEKYLLLFGFMYFLYTNRAILVYVLGGAAIGAGKSMKKVAKKLMIESKDDGSPFA